MRGTKIHLWLLTTGELACDLKSVISEAVSWKSSQNHNISFFNRTNNLPLIYRHVWFTLLDWIQFAIDDLISGHICFHSYHCCVHVWKVTSIQFRFRDILCWTYWCVVNVGWWMFQGKELASKANFSPMQCRFGFCRVEKIVLATCVKIRNLNKGFFFKTLGSRRWIWTSDAVGLIHANKRKMLRVRPITLCCVGPICTTVQSWRLFEIISLNCNRLLGTVQVEHFLKSASS